MELNSSLSRDGQISCQDVHFTSIEDIYLKSSILRQSSILSVSGALKKLVADSTNK